ncbi:MAG: CapA family protein [Cytophagales bacterium]|nr:MAG: CapA family protein [Cytophagales bacterium]TAF60695.1 MAG: CapA family protein [Cytophagales bacterium]
MCKKPILLSLLAFALCSGFFSCQAQTENTVVQTTQVGYGTEPPQLTKQPEKKGKDTLRIIGVGDMMLGTNYPSTDYLPPNDGKDLMKAVYPILSAADLTFGNLEGTVLDKGGEVKQCGDPSVCFAFKMPEYLLQNLLDAGFDVLSIANNHVSDFGATGRANTQKALKNLGIPFAGLLDCPTTVFEKDGIKYGMVAFAPNSGTVPLNDLENARKLVRELDAKCDIVIVSFHGGAEGASRQHVTRKNELFYGENRGNVYAFAHAMIDEGADLIFGHGPHVTRAVEVYKNRFIAYSLGNFCTYARFGLKGPNGVAPIIEVQTNSKGEFFKAKITPIVQQGKGVVAIDPNKQAIKYVQELTKADFPECPIVISDDGIISNK